MELKLLCGCGQKYAFDVEPVSGRMPFAVNCPGCGTDGTPAANAELSKLIPPVASASVIPVALAPSPMAATPTGPTRAYAGSPAAAKRPAAKEAGMYSLPMGILGAVIGAAVTAGLMYGFYQKVGFRFPLLGVGIGAATGLLARVMAKGTDSTLGAVAGAIALVATGGALWAMYGEIPGISIISIVVSVSVAYRTAS